MNTSRSISPEPQPSGPVPAEQLLAGRPPLLDVGDTVAEIRAGRRLVVLDDDPTGTQSIADLPVLTGWSVADLRWALRQPTTAFFVLTNTRSLAAADAAQRNREIVRALDEAARLEQVPYVLHSRGDSTLRGYYPLETDVLAEELARTGTEVDGVLICPAYIEPGRVTVDSVHWMRTNGGMIPVAESEFAKDASFGYHHSDLRDWVAEKTAGRIGRDQVATITLTDIREGGPDRVQKILSELTGGRPVVVDAADDADLRVVSLALVRAEAEGRTFVYRTGPSFVRARSGQTATPAIDAARLARITAAAEAARAGAAESDDPRPVVTRGLIVVGSHVGLTTRQLDRLRAAGGIVELELDVPTLLDPDRHDAHLADIAARAEELLRRNDSGSDVVIRTSRTLVTGGDAAGSLHIARTVSAALVGTVRELVGRVRPSFVLAKGGITSSDTATEGLGIRRAWSRGTMLPGIVSLWEPAAGPARGIPYIVFAGNVGDDDALADVVATLRHA
ncbi:four-carbon acid sugar kinase family protein [Nakamurella sp.]|uniref:four-carbon acid sugar kinase family protein n=1 Tax=Nakamurella sp. TaxID=1869182 RepID=UPI003B3A9B6B